MTRSINIIQQPDCYRTYNKKTHIERADLQTPDVCSTAATFLRPLPV